MSRQKHFTRPRDSKRPQSMMTDERDIYKYCDKCSFKTFSGQSLAIHKNNHENEKGIRKCKHCSFTSNSPTSARRHVNRVHRGTGRDLIRTRKSANSGQRIVPQLISNERLAMKNKCNLTEDVVKKHLKKREAIDMEENHESNNNILDWNFVDTQVTRKDPLMEELFETREISAEADSVELEVGRDAEALVTSLGRRLEEAERKQKSSQLRPLKEKGGKLEQENVDLKARLEAEARGYSPASNIGVGDPLHAYKSKIVSAVPQKNLTKCEQQKKVHHPLFQPSAPSPILPDPLIPEVTVQVHNDVPGLRSRPKKKVKKMETPKVKVHKICPECDFTAHVESVFVSHRMLHQQKYSINEYCMSCDQCHFHTKSKEMLNFHVKTCHKQTLEELRDIMIETEQLLADESISEVELFSDDDMI